MSRAFSPKQMMPNSSDRCHVRFRGSAKNHQNLQSPISPVLLTKKKQQKWWSRWWFQPTHLKNTRKSHGIIPPIFGVKIKKVWNHQLDDDGTGGLFPWPFGVRQIFSGELLNFQGVMSFAKCIYRLLFTIALAQGILCDPKIDVLKVVQIWGMVPLSSKDSLDESLLH